MAKNIEDLTGNVYGKLTVIDRVFIDGKTKWKCLCECGKTKLIRKDSLTSGHTKSCGCSSGNFRQEIGQRYGRLIVMRRSEKINNEYTWVCLCDCGKTRVVRGSSLRRGFTKSCGCLASEIRHEIHSRDVGSAAFYRYYTKSKYGAKKRGLSFNLTQEEVMEINSRNCFYCGTPPSQRFGGRDSERYNGDYIYNGIDRVDNSIGYEINNVVACCKICNYAKRVKSIDEFKNWIVAVYNHWIVG